jgi:hypothetical protein
MIKWVLQNNLMKDHNIGKLVDFLEVQGVPWEGITVVPFDQSDIEGVDTSGITVFYGSVGLVRRVSQSNRWKPGVFFSPPSFAFQALLEGYGDNLLNADSEVLTMREIMEEGRPGDRHFFCRPVEDDKAFTGKVFSWKELREQAVLLKEADSRNRLQLDTKVQVAPTKEILHEVRNFVIGGKVSTSSFYGRGMMNQEVPQEEIEYAERMAQRYQPAEVFVLDTCLLADGSRRVVETNCMNSSGLYWVDVYKLVKDLNSYLLHKHG